MVPAGAPDGESGGGGSSRSGCKAAPPLRRDAERNRERILAAAREEFRERGVAATLNDVARRAHLGVGTVYRRFPDKEALVDALFVDMVDDVERRVAVALAEQDAWRGLARCLEELCEIQAFDRGLREVMLGTGRGPEREQRIRERIDPAVQWLVARAKRQGSLRTDFDPYDLPLIQLMVAATIEATGRSGLWRRYLALLLDGMRASAATSPLPPAGDWAPLAVVEISARQARSRRDRDDQTAHASRPSATP